MAPRLLRLLLLTGHRRAHRPPLSQRGRSDALESNRPMTWATTTDHLSQSTPSSTGKTPHIPYPQIEPPPSTLLPQLPSAPKVVPVSTTAFTTKMPPWARSASGPPGNRPATSKNGENWRPLGTRSSTTFLHPTPLSKPKMCRCLSFGM